MAEESQLFEFLGALFDIEEIASGRGVRVRKSLQAQYGGNRWRKMKGVAHIEDNYGWIGNAEIHWYEAHGIGRVGWKISKRFT